MSHKIEDNGDTLRINNDKQRSWGRELYVHRFPESRFELMIIEQGEKRCKICSTELNKEQVCLLMRFITGEI
jgi:hypothetical protein